MMSSKIVAIEYQSDFTIKAASEVPAIGMSSGMHNASSSWSKYVRVSCGRERCLLARAVHPRRGRPPLSAADVGCSLSQRSICSSTVVVYTTLYLT